MSFALKYVALYVPDLRAAEDFYRAVFAMTRLFRESARDDGTWCTIRPEVDWDDAESAGITIDMVALRREAFVLALFRGEPQPGTVFELCVALPADEIGAVHARLPRAATVIESQPNNLRFEDPFGFRWAVQQDDAEFRSSGEIAGRWVDAAG